jgi:hypothetical protein
MAGGDKMKKNESCPLDGSWMRDSCTTYHDQKNSGNLSNCQHRRNCAEARSLVESDINQSVTISKKVLIGQIPQIFEDKS